SEQQEAAVGQEIAVDDPGERRLGEPEVGPDRRERDADDGDVEHDHQAREAKDVERKPAPAGVSGVAHEFGLLGVWTVTSLRPGPDPKLIGRLPRVTTAASTADLERQLEEYRRELTGYCYRMLGSAFDAEDAVQETMVRAWRNLDRFEGRSALKSWLYRIATNVCLDMLGSKERRARPLELGPPGTADSPLTTLPETAWLEPIPDGRVLPSDGDPAELAEQRETLRLAFVAALQHLPSQQRAVLILREVLRWRANEVAELLETSVASVNSSLQRARAALDATEITPSEPLEPLDEEQQELLQRYVDAFQRYDMVALTTLLHEDAKQTMPPYELWLLGREEI